YVNRCFTQLSFDNTWRPTEATVQSVQILSGRLLCVDAITQHGEWDVASASNRRRGVMRRRFKVGDHVTWNSEAGQVSGTIIEVHTKDVNYKGYTHHASEAEPQYEIKSDKTDHIALHKGSALRRIER